MFIYWEMAFVCIKKVNKVDFDFMLTIIYEYIAWAKIYGSLFPTQNKKIKKIIMTFYLTVLI